MLAFTQSLHHEFPSKGVQVQVVLSGATRTQFRDRAGVPVQRLPQDRVMTDEDMADAAHAGLDQKELITIPALPTLDNWNRFKAARQAMKAVGLQSNRRRVIRLPDQQAKTDEKRRRAAPFFMRAANISAS